MGVFLRWGVFGILAVAALVYAYNASKRLAGARTPPAVSAPATPAAPMEPESAAPVDAPDGGFVAATPEVDKPLDPLCAHELLVAQKALEMRRQGEPLDRLLRIPEIAWEEPADRRTRLTQVATRWFNYESDFSPQALRIAVVNDCAQASGQP